MSAAEDSDYLQFVPFSSFMHPSFWHEFVQYKLDVEMLNETNQVIYGRFTYRDDVGSIFELDGTSFNESPQTDNFYINVRGTIINKMSKKDFKIDKTALLNSMGEEQMEKSKNKEWIENPSTLLNFFILSYADIKKHHFYYWFAFPVTVYPLWSLEESHKVTDKFDSKQLEDLALKHKSLPEAQKCFFAVTIQNEDVLVKPLSEFLRDTEQIEWENAYIGFADPSNISNPGWPLRIVLATLSYRYPKLVARKVQVIGLRCNVSGSVTKSKIYVINRYSEVPHFESSLWVGWERNDDGSFKPKFVNMAASMNTEKIADEASELNIKLMKWRLAPDIDMAIMKKMKCLLLGAGTLGCHVARDLLAWGFRHITFLDSGKVSFSNPVRQVLYTYEDCLNGGQLKAEVAAANLKLILPTVKSQGLSVHIPMPGHPVGDSLKEETLTNIKILTKEIIDHDVIFLLLDTREARWLPTLIGACHQKVVINAALGFDSYLVMRHGIWQNKNPNTESKTFLCGGDLGCYFCNDVTAPGNSLKDRTLDQQCTVTRPGVAAIAGALAVEILVGLLQHPLKVQAPALYNLSEEADNLSPQMEGVLGPIPHSIRGFLHSYQTILPTCAKFDHCVACSTSVIDKYKKDGIKFLLQVFNSGTYLEEVAGLSNLHFMAESKDYLLDLPDSDQED